MSTVYSCGGAVCAGGGGFGIHFGTRIHGGEKLWGALGDLWLMVGLGENILQTSLPERHLCHSWALLPISLQHLSSPLSYKSQWPLLFQSPLREGTGEGLCWQTWILMLLLAVLKHLTKEVSVGFGKELHLQNRSLREREFGIFSIICIC